MVFMLHKPQEVGCAFLVFHYMVGPSETICQCPCEGGFGDELPFCLN